MILSLGTVQLNVSFWVAFWEWSVGERPLFPGLYLIIVYNYKTITVPNNSLNPAHPIAVEQAKPQPKDQILVVLPFKLIAMCRPQKK